MFTQFFGNFLLNEGIVTKAQLIEALEIQKLVRVKLGVLAINAGLMTAKQVDEVHAEQQRVDKRFGDIAVEKGYLKASDVDELLSHQKQGQLILGQALVDKGYLSNEQFEQALASYKKTNSIQDKDFTTDQNKKIDTIIRNFYIFNTFAESDLFTEYVSLVFKNIIRFIGDDFVPLAPETMSSYQSLRMASQKVNGVFSCFTAIDASDSAFIAFAARYSGEEITKIDELAEESVSEFLNLHNGLFTVNMSNDRQLELELEPQRVTNGKSIDVNGPDLFVMPICFPFGTISVIISSETPNLD